MGKRCSLAGLALAGLLPALAGCLNFAHPVRPEPGGPPLDTRTIPEYCRNRVYIVFLDGFDPVAYANLEGTRDHVQKLGFIKTYYGQIYHVWHFAKALREVHDREPDARFLVVGYSVGAHAARKLCLDLGQDGLTIDALLYLDAFKLEDSERTRPANVERSVHVVSEGAILGSKPFEGVENIHIDWKHHGVPTHPKTLDLLTRELATSAARVPLVTRAVPRPYDLSPTPVPVKEETLAAKERPGEWDFLKPDSPEGLRGLIPGHLAQGEPATLQMAPEKSQTGSQRPK